MLENYSSKFQLELLLNEINLIIDAVRENVENNTSRSNSYEEMRHKIDKLQFIAKNVDYQFSSEEEELNKRVGFLISKNEIPLKIIDFIFVELKKEEFLNTTDELWASHALEAFEKFKIELPKLVFEKEDDEEGRMIPKTGITANAELIHLDKTLSLVTNVDNDFLGKFVELKLGSVYRIPELTYKSVSQNEFLSIYHDEALRRDLRGNIESVFSKGGFEKGFLDKINVFLTPAFEKFAKGEFAFNILRYYNAEKNCFDVDAFYEDVDYSGDEEVFIDLFKVKELLLDEIIKVIKSLDRKLEETANFLASYNSIVNRIVDERSYELNQIIKVYEKL